MVALGFNHVSVRAADLEQSVAFYQRLFGVERLEAPNFGIRLAWLRLGDLQLHIFERDCESNRYSHFGVEVDDFAAVYDAAEAMGAFDTQGYYGHHFFEVPSGELQLYLRDPAGNLLEVVRRDGAGLPERITRHIIRRSASNPQDAGNLAATLFLSPRIAA